MLKELLRIAAAALASALVQVATLLQDGGPITAKILISLVVGTVLVRVATWVVATFGPTP